MMDNVQKHNICIHNLYLLDIIRMIALRRMRCVAVCHAYKYLVRKSEGKGPLGSPRHRWEHDIKMDVKEIRWKGVDWIHLA
jgi:hypothetical protein